MACTVSRGVAATLPYVSSTYRTRRPVRRRPLDTRVAAVAVSDDTALIKRKFQFVPYGESSPAWPSLSCDGKVPGTTMDLTHWTNNETPDSIYADTSTEIALNFAHARAVQSAWREHDDAVVVNNHYDVRRRSLRLRVREPGARAHAPRADDRGGGGGRFRRVELRRRRQARAGDRRPRG